MTVPFELIPPGEPPTALVTGGARRIGRAFVAALAADGWRVVIHCNRSRAEADALATEIAGTAAHAPVVLTGDLGDWDAPKALLAEVPGPVTLLVNNASAFDYDALADFDAARWQMHMDVNCRAPALLSRAFAAALPEGSGGLIVNILDSKLNALNPDFFSYTLSKIGLAGVTELTARALAPRIRVNGIAPAVTLVSGPQSRENFEAAHVMNPLGRGVDVAHLVSALRYLIATPSVTGQILTLDSGQRFLGLPRDVAFMTDL